MKIIMTKMILHVEYDLILGAMKNKGNRFKKNLDTGLICIITKKMGTHCLGENSTATIVVLS